MSEAEPKPTEHFTDDEIIASEPDRLPPQAHAACDDPDEPDTDVVLADEDRDDEPAPGDQIDGNLSGADQ